MNKSTQPLLAIEGLKVAFPGQSAPVIDGLSLTLHHGEVLALVGESGSGKSMTALSLMRLLPAGGAITGGRIRFNGEDILSLSDRQMNQLRGAHIAMLFQQPQAMLDPTSRVSAQIAESLRLHRGFGRRAAMERVLDLLREVGICDPAVRARSFSHELSGGMAQRVMIAAALSGDPEMLIADEPTTALDVTVQAQILRLIDEERRKRNLATLLITHDLTVVGALADRVAVMYAGRIVEEGPTKAVLEAPQHPYTQALIRCSLLVPEPSGQLLSIPGSGTHARKLSCGCRFHPRCSAAAQHDIESRCMRSEPELSTDADGHKARCWAIKTEKEVAA
ncbi:dipeptide ABC transporter ATP-binding protein DppD [Burkholderia ubonensis]|uniref:ABC transporter ATP-binding protein n=1 Tax=Burkholderia ubonensis TaxID=101571 RepID=UPI000BA765D2|nr:ABC transporter ATP-binding protein [Burkholderia ubonensis]PAK11650.1 dipeptide ABC transporter ATP-binding protein DppD [Burkholderia ubonensis]RQP86075.1 ABC transporter ATP-binding protein [Burkholderia ubonensis]